MAPNRIRKIAAVVRIDSTRHSTMDWNESLRRATPIRNAPTAPAPAASVGVNTPP
jgi:hypothetical protein